MKSFVKIFTKIEAFLVEASLAVMCIFIFAATFCRYTGIKAIPWSEELGRTLMIWMALLGAGSVARKGNHFTVDFIFTQFSNKYRRIFFVVIAAIVAFFSVFVMYFGTINCIKQYNIGQLSPGMQLPYWLLYACVPIGGLSIGVQSLVFYIPLITGRRLYSSSALKDTEEAEELETASEGR